MTTLRAAEKFDKSHLTSEEVAPLVDGAKVIYVGGFFLTHGVESALEVAKKAAGNGKVRCSGFGMRCGIDRVGNRRSR